MRFRQLFIPVICVIFFSLNCKEEKKIKEIYKNEYFIVLDTSGSMALGPFPHIQKKISELMDLLREGDQIYLISFDTRPVILKKIDSYRISQKEELLDIVKDLKPVGLYTDFQTLLEFIKKIIQDSKKEQVIQKEDEVIKIKKRQYIIILTDGKDEPPEKRKPIDINQYKVKEPLPIRDRYIYYVSFSNQKSKQLEKNLQTLSPNVKTIERPVKDFKNGDDHSGIEEIKRDIQKHQKERQSIEWKEAILNFFKEYGLYFIGAFVLVGVLLAIFYRFVRPIPLQGELMFYEVGTHPSMGRTVKLSRFEKRKLSIGRDPLCLIRIKTKEFPAKIEFKAVDKKGTFYFKIPKKYNKEIQFLSQKENNMIQSGDKFKIKNFIFEYSYGSKKH